MARKKDVRRKATSTNEANLLIASKIAGTFLYSCGRMKSWL